MTAPRLKLRSRQVLTFLRQKSGRRGFCWWKQSTIAKALGCDLRTINRAIKELVDAGEITSTPHRTCNLYIVRDLSKSLSYLAETVEKSASYDTPFVPATTNLSYLETPVLICEGSKTLSKQAAPRLTDWLGEYIEAQLACLLPSPTVTNGDGRPHTNPEWRQIQREVENAERRIRKATNPLSYVRGIVLDVRAKYAKIERTAGDRAAVVRSGDPATGKGCSLRPFESDAQSPVAPFAHLTPDELEQERNKHLDEVDSTHPQLGQYCREQVALIDAEILRRASTSGTSATEPKSPLQRPQQTGGGTSAGFPLAPASGDAKPQRKPPAKQQEDPGTWKPRGKGAAVGGNESSA